MTLPFVLGPLFEGAVTEGDWGSVLSLKYTPSGPLGHLPQRGRQGGFALCDNVTEKAAEIGYTVIKQKERSYPLWQL